MAHVSHAGIRVVPSLNSRRNWPADRGIFSIDSIQEQMLPKTVEKQFLII